MTNQELERRINLLESRTESMESVMNAFNDALTHLRDEYIKVAKVIAENNETIEFMAKAINQLAESKT